MAACGPAALVCAAATAFATSAFITGVTGGSWSQAFRSGLIAAATVVAFDVAGEMVSGMQGGAALAKGGFGAGFGTTAHIFKIASHAAIGCLSAVAGGGKCGAGALAAGVSAGATPFYHTGSDAGNIAVAGLVGGAASKLGGGSFSDGAVTAAFGYMFNQAMSRARAAAGQGASGPQVGGFPKAYDVDISINPLNLPTGLLAIYMGLQVAVGAGPVYQSEGSGDTEKNPKESAPSDRPSGTRPIDKWGIPKDDVHDIKEGIDAGPTSWVGIKPDGTVGTTGQDGKWQERGHVDDFTNKPLKKFPRP